MATQTSTLITVSEPQGADPNNTYNGRNEMDRTTCAKAADPTNHSWPYLPRRRLPRIFMQGLFHTVQHSILDVAKSLSCAHVVFAAGRSSSFKPQSLIINTLFVPLVTIVVSCTHASFVVFVLMPRLLHQVKHGWRQAVRIPELWRQGESQWFCGLPGALAEADCTEE
jgi:hypothetical protein